jgi:hypothetical protein
MSSILRSTTPKPIYLKTDHRRHLEVPNMGLSRHLKVSIELFFQASIHICIARYAAECMRVLVWVSVGEGREERVCVRE